MRNLKFYALLFLIPLALLILGGWQLIQFNELPARRIALQSKIEKVSEASTVTFSSGDRVVVSRANAPGVLALKQELRALDPAQPTVRWRGALPIVTLMCGLLALLVATVAVWRTHQLAQRARQSRDQLLRIFGQAMPYVPLVTSSLTLLVAIGAASSCAFFAMTLYRDGVGNRDLKIAVIASLVAIGLLWAALLFAWRAYQIARQSVVRPPMSVLGRVQTPAEAPLLWAWVSDIAKRLEALKPDHIVVGLSDGFYVTSHPVTLQPVGETLHGHTLHIPLGHLAVLSEAESASIIAHELAHFAGEDTNYSLRFLPLYDGMERSLASTHIQMGENWIEAIFLRPAWYFGGFFFNQFDFAVSHFSREREFVADTAGAKISGPNVAASALLRSIAIAPVIDAVLQQATRSTATGEDAITLAYQYVATHGFGDPHEHLADVIPHPSDTHPPTLERLRAFGQPPGPELFGQATRAVPETAHTHLAQFFQSPQTLADTLTRDVVANYRGLVDEQLAARKRIRSPELSAQ